MRANIPKGIGGGPQNMSAMIRQAQKMQEDMEALQADLDEREYDISAGGGMVKLKINGKREVLSIDISPDIVDPDDVETLADIITAAVNEGIKRVDDTNASEMSKVTGSMGGLGLPGMF
ncbi:MAG: YbaB/EbfC family nucleoid-associated protein [Clostridia bacterium]|nr:YbaB/EbfC family nucleoid-associated protein [Clostridia bacterium]